MEKIECVAIKFKNKIWCQEKPHRHHDIIKWLYALHAETIPCDDNQGFLTNKGKFVTRNEAEVIARRCGQLTKPLIGLVLTSEDLW